MNLDYNILWVENEEGWFKDTKETVEFILSEEGFKLQCTYNSSFKEVDELITKNGLKNFDLILVDLSLNNGEKGNKIIENIRKHQIYTDVIFYSQNIEAVKEVVKSNELEGVYVSKRDRADFEDKFEKVFKTTVRKIQDVSSIRGLVMAETSKLDRKVEAIILKFYNCASPENKARILKYISEKLISSTKSSLAKAESLTKETNIDTIVEERIFDSYKKVQAVGEIIEIRENPNNLSKNTFIDNYNNQVIDLRNNLAHVEEKIDTDDNTYLATKKGSLIVNDEKCKSIRKELITQDGILEKLLSVVCEDKK